MPVVSAPARGLSHHHDYEEEAEGTLSERACLSRPDTSMAPPPAVKAAFEWQMVADNVG